MKKLKLFILDAVRRNKLVHAIFNPLFLYMTKKHRKNDTVFQEKNKQFLQGGAELLAYFKSALDAHKLKFWLTSGTLLGAYREHKLLGHDIDLDVAMFIEDMPGVKSALQEKGFVLEHEFGVNGEGVKEQTYSYKGIKIDIFYIEKISDKFVSYVFFKNAETDPDDKFRVINIFFPQTDFIEYDFLDGKYLIPEKTAEYLTANYGPNFMTPNKYWDYTRDIYSAKYYNLNEKQGFQLSY